MKIYTKTGDKGQTSLLGGNRVLKSHVRIEAYGTVDELNAHIGLLKDQEINRNKKDIFRKIQDCLFTIGSCLAVEENPEKFKIPLITEKDIQLLETEIDAITAQVPPLKNFILPGGHVSISVGHVARCVCRRAERAVVKLTQEEDMEINEQIIIYLNRLSDYLFIICRKMHQELAIPETPWEPQR